MIYEKLIRPFLFALDAERSHELALSGLQFLRALGGEKILKPLLAFEHPSLQVRALNLVFPNPVGLAAGFDKDARHLESLACLGFGFLEAGTVTFLPQAGNRRPRLRRLPRDEALWNHLGFNNGGAKAAAFRLSSLKLDIPLGINLGKSAAAGVENAAEDYLAGFQLLSLQADYVALNVSSPNTPGLRSLQEPEKLTALLAAVRDRNKAGKPILIKVSPDLSPEALEAAVDIGLKHNVRGFIAANTTLDRTGIKTPLPPEGGVSGKPLRSRSTEMIRRIRRQAGKGLCVIGCGGIFSAEDAYEKIKAGANLIQIYTGLVYKGPGIVRNIKEGLTRLLNRDGFGSLEEAVGVSVK